MTDKLLFSGAETFNDPADAFRRWEELSEEDKAKVQTAYMAALAIYGIDRFVQAHPHLTTTLIVTAFLGYLVVKNTTDRLD